MRARSKQADSSRTGAGCLTLFALPFAIAGLVVLGFGLFDVWDWARMRAWAQTPARVLDVRLVESVGDSVTYRVEAQYEYQYTGQRFVGTRVAISTGSDNVGSFHQDAYAELQHARDHNLRVNAYVNPAKPAEAVLYRHMRTGMLALKLGFGFVFAAVGLGLMFGAWSGKRRAADAGALRELHPKQPWRWRSDWEQGRIPGAANRGALIGIWAFALLWSAISTPVAFLIPGAVSQGNKAALIGWLFPLVGVGLLTWAVRASMRWRRFGQSLFTMPRVPAKLGGELRGAIETRVPIDPPEGITLTLSCIERTTRRTRGESETSERILYQDRKQLPQGTGAAATTGWRIPVRFMLPADQPETDDDSTDSKRLWRLEIDAPLDGVDLHDQFEIPVFGRAHPGSVSPDARPPSKASIAGIDLQAMLRPQGIDVISGVDGAPALHLRRARHRGALFGTLAFTAIWFGAIAFMVAVGAPLWFAAIFVLFGLLVGYFALDLLLDRATLTVRQDAIEVRRGWFGAGKSRTFNRAAMRSVQITGGMQVGRQLYHDIKIDSIGARPVTVARSIRDRDSAERIKAWLEQTR